MDDPLAGIGEKIKRADAHRDELEAEVRAFLDSKPYSVTIEPDPERDTHVIRAHDVREPPLSLGVILGDWAHNLRSALDHLVWQIITASEIEEPGWWNAFPIYDDPDLFNRKVRLPRDRGKRSWLFGVDDQTFSNIERYQPYHRVDGKVNALGLLRDLSNTDKHEVVHTAFAAIKPEAPRVTGSGFVRADFQLRESRVYEGGELGLIDLYVRDGDPQTQPEVDMNAALYVDIRFGDSQVPLSKLHEIRNIVVMLLNHFAKGFSARDPT